MSTLILPKPSTQPDLYHGKWVAGLFASGEQGAWYDPSDFSTMFQDAAGTTPVTAMEQPVGLILDKSNGLVLGPELVTNGDFTNGTTGWTASDGTQSVSNSELIITATGASYPSTQQFISCVVGKTYVLTATVRKGGGASSAGVKINGVGGVYTSSVSNVSLRYQFVASFTSYTIAAAINGSTVAGDTATFDNISVRELPGNHAYQSTSASRPVLSARYNLLTKTEQFDDAAWSKARSSITANAVAAPDGTVTADKIVEDTTASSSHEVQQSASGLLATVYSYSVYAKSVERGVLQITFSGNGGSAFANYDLSNGVVGTTGNSGVATIVSAGNGWYKCTLSSGTAFTAGVCNFVCMPQLLTTAGRYARYTGDGTSGIYIWGASLVPANQADLPYQRVNTATDYDTAGFPHYLKFDGIDDFLVTNSIDFTATDKMTVCAGVRKLSDAAIDVVAEISDTNITRDGSWALYPTGTTPATAYFASRGTTRTAAPGVLGTAPKNGVLTGIGDISGDKSILRINGAQVGSNVNDQGTGNYGNYPLYIGRRGGTSLPFNGRLYGLIVRGAQTDDLHLTHAEKYLAYKSGVTL